MCYFMLFFRLSALFAFEKIQAKKNDVIVIGGADGAFGSVLGQLAKEKVSLLHENEKQTFDIHESLVTIMIFSHST